MITFFKTHKTLIPTTILSLLIVFFTEDKCGDIFKNISYSIIAAIIIYIFIEYIPFVRKKKIMRILINSKLFELNEHVRLCKEIPITSFSMESKTYKDCKEYAEAFYKSDLEEKSIFSSSQTWKEYLESHKNCIANIISTLLNLHTYFSDKEQKIITAIATSTFLTSPIIPQNHNLPNNVIDSYPNNQKEIGESIYKIYELIKEIR